MKKGLGKSLDSRESRPRSVPPLVTFKGNGLAPEFQGASWEKIRDAIYEGRGA